MYFRIKIKGLDQGALSVPKFPWIKLSKSVVPYMDQQISNADAPTPWIFNGVIYPDNRVPWRSRSTRVLSNHILAQSLGRPNEEICAMVPN